MLGTQSPMKIACSAFPLKNKISEYTSESIAEIRSNLSVSVNFLNIFKILFPTHKAFQNTPRFSSGFWSPLYIFVFVKRDET